MAKPGLRLFMGALGSENVRWLPAACRWFTDGHIASWRQCWQLIVYFWWKRTVGILSCKAPRAQKLNQHFEVVDIWKLGKRLTDIFSVTVQFPSSRWN